MPAEPAAPRPEPPPLPPSLSRVGVVSAVGAAAWAVAAVAVLITSMAAGQGPGRWFATCVIGVVLGAAGYGLYSWQRAAARRGSRTAQDGVDVDRPNPR